MIVDDSLTVRTIFKRMVESDQRMTIAGTASSAERAIAQLAKTPADVILLDLEMPGMGGLEALPAILDTAGNAQVLVVSSLTEDGAEATVAALSMGAAETMLKPRPGGFNETYRTQLLDKIYALGGSAAEAAQPDANASNKARIGSAPRRGKRPEVLAIGASTGGIHALNLMLRQIRPDFDLPILITQHLPASFVPVFARQIEVASARKTVIAEDGREIRKGEVTIASGLGHLIVRRSGERLITKTSVEPVPSGCLPSVDPMLSSLSAACEGRVLAVILSGMGRDGLKGAQELVDNGGTIYAQNAETSAVWGMPGAVTKAGLTSLIGSPEDLGRAVAVPLPIAAAK
ncbi:chemotaxis-specific protein-glutamate methyltransferase CheB [Erythrobacter insulae]|nr:chemotaxis-specific protein-glutamate methyltransferase CheB [Erythrobacter insulae]